MEDHGCCPFEERRKSRIKMYQADKEVSQSRGFEEITGLIRTRNQYLQGFSLRYLCPQVGNTAALFLACLSVQFCKYILSHNFRQEGVWVSAGEGGT